MGNLTITVARKPLIGTVAKNALKWGTGGLNIDESRIAGSVPSTVQGQSVSTGLVYGADQRNLRLFQPSGEGRWPPNVLLIHKAGCRCVGTKQVVGITGTAAGKMAGQNTEVYGVFAGSERAGEVTGYAGEDGLETVEAWECVEGCPVAELDQQSGERPVSGAARRGEPATALNNGMFFSGVGAGNGLLHDDSGGASRFFKQFQNDEVDDGGHDHP